MTKNSSVSLNWHWRWLCTCKCWLSDLHFGDIIMLVACYKQVIFVVLLFGSFMIFYGRKTCLW